jgi:heme o synthase
MSRAHVRSTIYDGGCVRTVESESLASASGPGALLRLSAAAAAFGVGLVVVSAVLELGATHWGLAAIALPLLVANAIVARMAYPDMFVRAVAAVTLFLFAVALGGAVAWSDGATWASVLHVGAAGSAFAASLLVLVAAFRGTPVPLATARDYLALTKPRIMTLLLLTGAAGMFVGAQGVPPVGLFVVTMVGLALACGGASALNHVLDRDIDVLMGSRTKKRPVASGRVTPEQALEFGVLLSALSFALLASAVNVLTAVLALVGNLFYVVVYTRWLKRSTPQNIVIGGAAGAVPPLVGYAAASGNLGLPALWLFLIVFLWTPPHFWALALLIKENYAAAKVPMLPVVRGDEETTKQIVWYSVVLVAFTLAVGFWLGVLYSAAALVLGGIFLVLAWQLRRSPTRRNAGVLFHYSLLYLALLFVAAALNPVLL